ncbi:hypothetical protein JR316_0008153 [Psilocybe cubensis]|uniref:Uncharacterized protein n=2 Tax=Psilocybe cubensis TaxID=181762 RepID=A0ACB8GVA1_PSICU|nr:hypothetical protein JR316_0008153 [Psilocybe cubensis]KAH9479558.1 hypothetical protein JR316_0008153 [Psilocybe cubensis]
MSSSKFKPLSTNDADLRLARFLSKHDDPLNRGFITRLDHSPIAMKRLAFFRALLLNTFILIALTILSFIMISQFLLSPPSTPTQTLMCITHDFIVASAIVVLIRSTLLPFFCGECRLRVAYGFRPSEIVIRRAPLLGKEYNRHTIARAVNPALLYSNVSAMLSSDYWTLEYTIILDALNRISKGEFPEDVLEFSVWKQREQTWHVWELWKMHDLISDEQEIAIFKVHELIPSCRMALVTNRVPQSLLIDSGKEELLADWQGAIADEKALDRSSTVRSYQTVVDKFAREGLDYESVWDQVSEKRKFA